jgi:uncharacterized flavoprotein (TIGR03862 family)
MAAEVAARGGAQVTIYERMPSPGRKFLLAGRGGLNLTHSEDIELMLARYGTAAARLRPVIEAFSPRDLRVWSEGLGVPTFVGTSGRVFPRSFKTSPLLRAWLERLASLGVVLKPRHRWAGWGNDGALLFVSPDGGVAVAPDASVLALGGASWPRLGSDGLWSEAMASAKIAVAPLRPANCGFIVDWSDLFKGRFEGQPLKGIALSFDGRTVRGEAMVTRNGLEGGGLYALSAALREAIAAQGEALLRIALRPDLDLAGLEKRLALRPSKAHSKQSLSNFLRKALKLSPPAIGLLQEVAFTGPERLSAMTPSRLASLINDMPVRLSGVAPLVRAISTAGGILFDEVDEHFMLTRRPGTFVAGEMLDWEAPTGGYLLQASFSTGAAAARGALDRLGLCRVNSRASDEVMKS